MQSSWTDSKRILAVQLGGVEDVALTTPALRAISDGTPQATLTLLTSAAGAQMAWLDHDIDDIIMFTPPWLRPATEWHAAAEDDIVAQLLAANFDAAIIFTTGNQSPFYAAALCERAHIPLRVALTADNPQGVLTMRVFPDAYPQHEVARMLRFVSALGFEVEDQALVATAPEDACANIFDTFAQRQLDTERQLVLVWPGQGTQAYPTHHYATAIDRLIERQHVNVFLAGLAHEQEQIQQIHAQLSDYGRRSTARLASALPFATLAAMVETVDTVITHDPAVMQLAGAMQTPVVALCAADVDVTQRAPWLVPAQVLQHDATCQHSNAVAQAFGQQCPSAVQPGAVSQATRQLLDAISPPLGETSNLHDYALLTALEMLTTATE